MNNSKLLHLLRKLKPKELNSIELYLQVPAFNMNKEVDQLFGHLKKFAPNFLAQKIEEKKNLRSHLSIKIFQPNYV